MKIAILLVAGLCLGSASSSVPALAQSAPAGAPSHVVPQAKQTALGLYVTPREAADIMRAEGGRILFVDVRTRGEMLFTRWTPMIDGHVPFVDVTEFWDWDDKEGRYRLEPNGTFSQDVQKLLAAKGLSKSDRVIVMCRSGDRSARAANKLVEAGFTNVYSQYEGFEGDQSPYGQRTVNGWKNAGLPWTYKPDRAKFYAGGF
ncbi:rhodanese-like domain-containing protein [Hansschlegelia zhihuaiae]|uniref:Sulfurtransferase n=1 Tax=Hansschlegelia zhihuaiae TaxID=405005 RepID=A0A4Q0MAP7_9HYPH|nr:rhodanese-like domain-containing protein [Hansschlegelia zhihuaiae]RXF69879.1 sulfurtransferase [Hansschlegelia zhihuaiae]